MKAHIGVDAQSALVQTVIGTVVHVSDITQAQALLHGDEIDALGDAGYPGVEKRKAFPATTLGGLLERYEHAKASIAPRSSMPFMWQRTCSVTANAPHKGLAKPAQLLSLFG